MYVLCLFQYDPCSWTLCIGPSRPFRAFQASGMDGKGAFKRGRGRGLAVDGWRNGRETKESPPDRDPMPTECRPDVDRMTTE